MSDLGFLGLVLVVLFFAWVATGGPERDTGGPFLKTQRATSTTATKNSNSFLSSWRNRDRADNSTTYDPVTGASYSPWRGVIELERGTAASTDYSNEEYIVIKNIAREGTAVTITGWRLKNAGDARRYPTDYGYRQGQSAIIPIQTGALLLLPSGLGVQQSITLAPKERAVVLSGGILRSRPIKIQTNFKVNKCSGYLEALPEYKFYPSIKLQCPDPESEPEVANFEDKCYDFIRRMSRCHTPEFNESQNDKPANVDGVEGLSRTCRNFLKERYNYTSCVARHGQDEDFYTDEWRVFLNVGALWFNSRETISLYDELGRLVDRISY